MCKSTFKRLPIVLALGLALGAGAPAAHELTAERSVIRDGARIAPVLRSSTEQIGDVFWATEINGEIWFFTPEGWSLEPEPWLTGVELDGDVRLFDFKSEGIDSGKYPLLVFTTDVGADPRDFSNWHGGLNGLRRLNFSINESPEVSTDLDGDGWPEDDRNKDGYSDDDRDYDGFHDDDHDEDGYHDDDYNEDGYHDDDYDLDGYHDEGDSDLDGFYDDDYDHDGIPDDEEDDDSSDDLDDDVSDDLDDDVSDDLDDDVNDDSDDDVDDDSDDDANDDSDDNS
jgi:hypothetical protein